MHRFFVSTRRQRWCTVNISAARGALGYDLRRRTRFVRDTVGHNEHCTVEKLYCARIATGCAGLGGRSVGLVTEDCHMGPGCLRVLALVPWFVLHRAVRGLIG